MGSDYFAFSSQFHGSRGGFGCENCQVNREAFTGEDRSGDADSAGL